MGSLTETGPSSSTARCPIVRGSALKRLGDAGFTHFCICCRRAGVLGQNRNQLLSMEIVHIGPHEFM